MTSNGRLWQIKAIETSTDRCPFNG